MGDMPRAHEAPLNTMRKVPYHASLNQIVPRPATSNETLHLCGFENDSVHWCLTTVTRMK